VRFCITSLRLLSVQDWEVFFERVSLVDQILRLDPANVYAVMDFHTRNRYREVVEHLARLTKQVEEDVTRQAITFSQKADPSSPQWHVGYYLIGEGHRQLEDWFQYRPSGRLALRRWLLAHPTPTYLVSMGLLSFLLMLVFTHYAASTSDNILQILGIGLLTFLPATAIATTMVNWTVNNSVAPHVLPRLDFQEGIPANGQSN
jgi:hypothetical protein